MRRRDVLIAGSAVAFAVAIPPILRRFGPAFELQPIPGFRGFRRVASGAVSGGFDPLAGLSARAPAAPVGSLCDVLYGATSWTDDIVPVAIFTDINCPNCAAQEARLLRLEQETEAIRLHWHPYPVLGPRSVWGAQVTLAAARQGADVAVHRDLMQRALRPGLVGLRDLAERHALDADALLRDAESETVKRKIDSNLGLGAALGIPGTPGTMIGRTLVIGAISAQDIRRLVELERNEPASVC